MEKRRFKRFAFREPVGISVKDGQDTGCLAADLSQGGVRLRVGTFIPLNTQLNLKIQLNNPMKVVPLMGRVVWVTQVPYSEHYDVGISFLSPSFELAIN